MERKLTHTAIALAVSSVFAASASAELLISEVVENGNDKAVEIYNPGTESVDLSQYALVQHNNQSATLSVVKTALEGQLAAKTTYVIAHSQLDGKLSGVVNKVVGLQFNGQKGDAVALEKNDVEIDLVGYKGGNDALEDSSLQRINVTAPSTSFDLKEWVNAGDGVYTGLGNVTVKVPEPVETVNSTIQEIQGESWTSTIDGINTSNRVYESTNLHRVVGTVTAIQTKALGSDLKVGFFMQAPSDGNELTSDGIFVQTNDVSQVKVGSNVTVVAKVLEDYSWTKLVKVDSITVNSEGNAVASTPLRKLDSDSNFDFTLERHEGMLIKMDSTSDMKVARTFSFDYGPRRSNMVVAHGKVNVHPNQVNAPGSDGAKAQATANKVNRVYVESFESAGNGIIPWYPDFAKASAVPMTDGTTTSQDHIRIGDVIDGLEGVLSYSYSEYRFFPTNTATSDSFVRTNPRTEKPVIKDGGLKVGTLNVLNYFYSPFGGDCNPMLDSKSTTGCNNRGADSQQEFETQGDKIAAAIVALDADILGLMEIENNGFGEKSAVAHLVEKVNALIPNTIEHYAFVKPSTDEKFVGTDAIANQVIFKKNKVTLDTYRLIPMPRQDAPETETKVKGKTKKENGKNYQRDSIAPTFQINGTKNKVTVSVNHFKSKGSTCWEDIDPSSQNGIDSDSQGSCENFRVSAAQHLGTQLKNIDGYKLILGDLNSYGSEDPVLLLTTLPNGHTVMPARNTFIGDKEMNGDTPVALTSAFGYRNMAQEKHPDAYSYSYNDTVGTLDYILVDPTLASKVLDANEWNINAPESKLFEYAVENSGALSKFKDMYRSSDHDPALITLDLLSKAAHPKPSIKPPKKPVNPPKDLAEKPKSVKPNQAMKVLFNLTDLGVDLHEGDKAVLNVAKVSSFNAATAGALTQSVTLTQSNIQAGWVELQANVAAKGNYQMTKTIIDGVSGDVTFASIPEAVTVADAAEETSSNSGASFGLGGLFALFGFGFLRRRRQ